MTILTRNSIGQGSYPKPVTGWHVTAAFMAVFAVMFAVNILFVVLALKTFSGETEHAYMKGLKFNETLAARHRQAETGWSMAVSLDRPVSGAPALIVALSARNGAPVTQLDVSGVMERTTTAHNDRALRFVETSPGTYRVPLTGLAPGRWRLVATAKRAGNPDFEVETILSLR